MKTYLSKRIKSSVKEEGYPASWTRNNFIDYLLQSDDNFIMLDEDGAYKYSCLPVTTENFNLTDKMVKQFKEDWVYGDYVGGVLWGDSKPYSTDTLPIYGRSDIYETKWFYEDKADAIKRDLSNRSMQLLKRANAYLNSSIKSATKWSEGGGDVDRFVEWHDDTELYMYPEVFDAIYEIFDDVLGENQSEDVREAFQRLSKEDQERIVKLIESTGYDI